MPISFRLTLLIHTLAHLTLNTYDTTPHTINTHNDTPTQQQPTNQHNHQLFDRPLQPSNQHTNNVSTQLCSCDSEAIVDVEQQLHRQFKTHRHTPLPACRWLWCLWLGCMTATARQRRRFVLGAVRGIGFATAVGVGYEVVRSRFSSFVFWRCFVNGRPLTITTQQSIVAWGVIGWGSRKRRNVIQQSTGIVVEKSNKLKNVIC